MLEVGTGTSGWITVSCAGRQNRDRPYRDPV
jgi:hypothetical protein